MFEDERGTIEDIAVDVDCVTAIFTRKGYVRGNHYHNNTIQMTVVISGLLYYVNKFLPNGCRMGKILSDGESVMSCAGEAHAWRALEDTACLVFTQGPRGRDYESDTYRLEDNLLDPKRKI